MIWNLFRPRSEGDLARDMRERRKASTPYSSAFVWRASEQIATALRHIHAANIIHRDLKPENILVFPGGVLKISDFGISKVLENTIHARSVVGTPHYLSPEICQGNAYSSASDVWSFGVVMYELTCLRRPFDGGNIGSVALKIVKDEVPDFAGKLSVTPEVPIQLQFVILGCLNKDPRRRMTLTEVLNYRSTDRFLCRADFAPPSLQLKLSWH